MTITTLKTKKKVCIITPYDLRFSSRTRREILAFRESGYEVIEVGTFSSGIEGVKSIIIPKTKNFIWHKSWLSSLFKLRQVSKRHKRNLNMCYLKATFDLLELKGVDLYIPHDLETLPLAIRLKKRMGGKIIFNSHDYQPRQFEERKHWKLFVMPMISKFFKKLLCDIDCMVTVSDSLANMYHKEYGIMPRVIRNMPFYYPSSFKSSDPKKIRIVYHGIAPRERRLEDLIKLMRYIDSRYELNLMLLSEDSRYINSLKNLAKKVAFGRVNFAGPLVPDQIVPLISEYDIGIILYRPGSFKLETSLPNKLFEFIMAGNCVIGGVSGEIKKILKQYNCGIYIDKIDYRYIAGKLNSLTTTEIDQMKLNSLAAAKELNADREMKIFMDIVAEVLN